MPQYHITKQSYIHLKSLIHANDCKVKYSYPPSPNPTQTMLLNFIFDIIESVDK